MNYEPNSVEFRLVYRHNSTEDRLKLDMYQHEFIRWSYLLRTTAAVSGNLDSQAVKDLISGTRKDFSDIITTYLKPSSIRDKQENIKTKLSQEDKLGFLAKTAGKKFSGLQDILQTLNQIKIT